MAEYSYFVFWDFALIVHECFDKKGHNSTKWPQNEKIRILYFIKLLKLKKGAFIFLGKKAKLQPFCVFRF